MKKIILSLASLIMIMACQQRANEASTPATMESRAMTADIKEAPAGFDQAQSDAIKVTPQKIIRNGNMTISVTNAQETRSEINTILENHKAYVGNEQLDNNDYQTSYTIQIRVPADQLDALVSDLEALHGTVTFKSINARDVTEEFIDLESRLTNKKAYLDQYRTLLKNARTIEDILKVQEQIRQLEEEIESTTGRLKYLTNQVDLSTLDLTLIEKKDYVFRPDYRLNFVERLKDSLSGGWYGFIIFCLAVFRLWPFWIAGFVLLMIWKRYKSRKTAKK